MSAKEFAIYSANVFTGNPKQPWAQAVGVKDGLIAAVGTNQEVKDALPGTEALELPGRLVSPGLTDGHCHFISHGQALLGVDLRNLTSLEACRQRIREAAAQAKPGEWILGRSWNHHLWSEGREPNKHDLDDLLPHNPAMMVRVCGHSQWLNSKGLEAAGITAQSPDPPGGKFEKDESGEPTGLLREARRVVMAHVPPPTTEYLMKAARVAQDQALKSGLTRVHTYESLAEWKAFSALEQAGELKLRVHHLLQSDELDQVVQKGLKPGQGSDRLWVGQIKLYADGSLGANTALMFEPYCDEPDNCGLPFFDLDKLKRRIAAAYEHGFSVAIHAIGDKATSNSLDAITWAREQHPGARRDSIDHVQICRSADLERFRQMGVVASVQPIFVPTDWPVAQRRWGKERCRDSYAWKTIMEMGIPTQFGSDAPVEPIAPILGLQAAVLRQSPDLKPEGGWRPEERLTLEQGLAGYTQTAAWIVAKEDRLGSIEPGKWADLTVFQRDLAQVPPEEWAKIQAEMTIIGGEVVHQI